MRLGGIHIGGGSGNKEGGSTALVLIIVMRHAWYPDAVRGSPSP